MLMYWLMSSSSFRAEALSPMAEKSFRRDGFRKPLTASTSAAKVAPKESIVLSSRSFQASSLKKFPRWVETPVPQASKTSFASFAMPSTVCLGSEADDFSTASRTAGAMISV